MDRKQRTLEELITLQDTAIEALKQALAATQLALEVVTRARNEHGTVPPMFPTAPENPFPYVVPNQPWVNGGEFQPKWTLSSGIAGGQAGMVTANQKGDYSLVAFNAAQIEQKAIAAVTMSNAQQSFAQKLLEDYKVVYEVAEPIEPQGAFASGEGCIK